MIKVSVIIPVYNDETYIEECLESILTQTLKDVEIICVDDGSTDSSYRILTGYGNKYRNITVLHQQNQGSGPARNRGIEHAAGKYICFMDSDDFYAHNRVLEQLYESAEANQASVCGGNLVRLREDGTREKSRNGFDENGMLYFKDYGVIYNYTCFIFLRKLIQENHLMFPPYKRFQDPPFLLNVMAHAKKFYAVNEVVYIYRMSNNRIHPNLTAVTDTLKGVRDCFQISYEYNLTKPYEKCLKDILRQYLWMIYPYAVEGQEDVWNLICEINQISKKWRGEISEIFADKVSLEAYIKKLKEKRSALIEKCYEEKEAVIYGAGRAGQYFLKKLEKEGIHIDGFAVSQDGAGNVVDGYVVKRIEDYNRRIPIMVAAAEKNAKEMIWNLEHLEFQTVLYMKYEDCILLDLCGL